MEWCWTNYSQVTWDKSPTRVTNGLTYTFTMKSVFSSKALPGNPAEIASLPWSAGWWRSRATCRSNECLVTSGDFWWLLVTWIVPDWPLIRSWEKSKLRGWESDWGLDDAPNVSKCRFLHRLHGLQRIAYKRLTLPYHQLQHLRVTTCQHTSGSSGCETIQGFQDLPSFASSPTNQFDFGHVVVPRVFPETDGFNICQLNNAKLLASPCFSWVKNW